jgi:NADH dehydrogenase (ubiquinone) 1 beta subcomplex subunit 8
VLALHDYNHFTPQWGFVLMGTFIASVFGLCAAVGTVYPDKLSAPKTYPDGLEAELGGKGALLVSAMIGPIGRMLTTWIGKEAG